MSDMDRRAFVGTAALGGVAAAVLTYSSAEAGDNSGYFVIAEIVSTKEKADELRALLVPYAEKSAKEPGCLKYVLMEVIGEPGRFLTYERWTNKAALDAHMSTPDIKEIVPKLQPIWPSQSVRSSWMVAPVCRRWPAENRPTAGCYCKAYGLKLRRGFN